MLIFGILTFFGCPNHPSSHGSRHDCPFLPATTIPEMSVSGLKIPLKGVFLTSSNPPPHQTVRQRVCSSMATLSACILMQWGIFSISPNLPHIKMQDGRFAHPPLSLRLTFWHNGGIFNIPPASLTLKHEVGFAYPPFGSHLVFGSPVWSGFLTPYFQSPPISLTLKHEMEGLLIHHYPFDLCFNAIGVFLTSPQPLSHRNARWGLLTHPLGHV